jgi:hypothetical protein
VTGLAGVQFERAEQFRGACDASALPQDVVERILPFRVSSASTAGSD